MKALFSILVSALISISSLLAQSTLQFENSNYLIEYNNQCMSVYEYHTDDGYIVEENYTNYHIPINDEKTIIIKVNESSPSYSTLPKSFQINLENLTCFHFINLSKSTIQNINNDYINLFIKFKGKYYKARAVILQIMSEDYMEVYSPPYESFVYHYDVDHHPGSSLPTDDNVNYVTMDTRFTLYSETSINGIRNDIFLKIYNDACHGRELGVTTPRSDFGDDNEHLGFVNGDSKSSMYLRSCQHPIQVEYLQKIGLYKETYYENGKAYVSQLVSVNDVAVDTFMQLIAPNIILQNPKLYLINDVIMAQKGEVNLVQTKVQAKNKNNSIGTDSNGNILDKKVTSTPTKTGFALPETQSRTIELTKTHTIRKGETLFSISKRYNVSVNDLKRANDLKNNTIYSGKELIIPKIE